MSDTYVTLSNGKRVDINPPGYWELQFEEVVAQMEAELRAIKRALKRVKR